MKTLRMTFYTPLDVEADEVVGIAVDAARKTAARVGREVTSTPSLESVEPHESEGHDPLVYRRYTYSFETRSDTFGED